MADSDVAAAQLPNGVLQVLAVDEGHAIRTCWKVSDVRDAAWTPWIGFPGQARRITSGSLPGGVPQLWAVGVDDRRLYSCWKVSDQPGAAWTDWGEMPGAPASVIDVAAVQLPQGFLQLFAIDAGHAIWTCWKVSNQPGAAWTDWMRFPGQARRITSGSLPGGVPQLWAVGADDRKLYTCWKTTDRPDADWTGWGEMPGAPTPVVDVAAAQLPQGSLQLFAIDGGHAIRTCWKVSNQPGAAWTGWMQFPGLARRITSGSLPGGVPQLWAVGIDDRRLYSCWKVSDQPGAAWTDWGAFDGGADRVGGQASLDMEKLGQLLTGWDKKEGQAAEYKLSDSNYRTYKPAVAPTADGGLYIFTKLDHIRGLAKDDHAIVELTLNAAGDVESWRVQMEIQGNPKFDTGLVTSLAAFGGPKYAAVAKVASEVLNSLSDEIARRGEHGGRAAFPSVVQWNILHIASCFRAGAA